MFNRICTKILENTAKCLYCFLFMCWASIGMCQVASDSVQTKKKLFREKSIIPLPVVFRLPETRWGGGAAVVSAFSFARDSSWSKPSQLSFGVTYTQNKQVLVFLPFNIFAKNNRYYFNSDSGWFRFNFFYYGIGENRVSQEVYDVDFPRIRLLAAKAISKTMYLGLRYQYESYRVTKTQEGGELASGRVAGSSFSRTSSIGVSVLKDTRDSVFYPRNGIFGEVYFLPTLTILGADRNFARFYADIAHYQSISPKLVLATNYVGSVIMGRDIPFNQLSLLGGPKKMRGVYEGYFRDKNTLLAQAELRWEVWKRLGLIGFGTLGFLGDNQEFLRFNKPKYTYGLGLRIATKKHLNIRLDYGASPYEKGNFYATIGEAF